MLTGLTSTQLSQLLSGITGLLNGAFGQITAPTSLGGASATPATPTAPAVNVLNLSLGPVNLNLLGLVVHLDNCHNGPVTVDITAQPGPGNLLGNLIAGVAHLLDTPANQAAILTHLRQVANEILGRSEDGPAEPSDRFPCKRRPAPHRGCRAAFLLPPRGSLLRPRLLHLLRLLHHLARAEALGGRREPSPIAGRERGPSPTWGREGTVTNRLGW